MKIVKTKTPKEVREFDGDYPQNLDPVDVVEIFNTPLLVLTIGIILYKIIVLKNFTN